MSLEAKLTFLNLKINNFSSVSEKLGKLLLGFENINLCYHSTNNYFFKLITNLFVFWRCLQ